MAKAKGFIRLIRPINCVMMAFAVLIGEIVVSGFEIPFFQTILAMAVAFLLTGAAMVLNDIVDLKADEINEPHRPIPSGLIKIQEAKYYWLFLSVCGIISAFFINYLAFGIAIFYWVLSSLYDLKIKRTGLLGNLVVSASVAVPFIYGGLVVFSELNVLLIFFFVVAFFANTGREITKGIADIEGDKLKGYQTLAVRYGSKKAAIVAAIFYLAAVALSPIPYLMNIAGLVYFIIVGLSDISFIILTAKLLRNPSRQVARKVKKQVLIAMFLALLSFITIPFF